VKTVFLVTVAVVSLVILSACGGDQRDGDHAQAQQPAPQPAPPADQHAAPPTEMPGGHPPLSTPAEIDLSDIAPATGGKTVAAVWAERHDLAGSEIAVRGRVVKFLPSIMNRNWLHLRDGTGEAGTNDLTVTTQATAQVGDLVTVTGRIVVDRDFGAGYRYEVIMEDAAVVPE
jgi:hypothetical protein